MREQDGKGEFEVCGGVPEQDTEGSVDICRRIDGESFSFILEYDPDDPKAPMYKRVLMHLIESIRVVAPAVAHPVQPQGPPEYWHPPYALAPLPTPDPCGPYHPSQEELDNTDVAADTPTPLCTPTAAPRAARTPGKSLRPTRSTSESGQREAGRS